MALSTFVLRGTLSPFEKGGQGGFMVYGIPKKSPSIPLFQRGRWGRHSPTYLIVLRKF